MKLNRKNILENRMLSLRAYEFYRFRLLTLISELPADHQEQKDDLQRLIFKLNDKIRKLNEKIENSLDENYNDLLFEQLRMSSRHIYSFS